MERGSLEEINSRLEQANKNLRALCGRAARAISAGCVGTDGTLALVAELEGVAGKEKLKSDWVQSFDGSETIRENTDNSTRLNPLLDDMGGKGSSVEIQVNKLLATIGKGLIDEGHHEDFEALSKTLESYASIIRLIETTLPRVTDCSLMAHGLGSSFPITSVGWNQASKLERKLNTIAAELRKERNA